MTEKKVYGLTDPKDSMRRAIYELWSEDGVYYYLDPYSGERLDFPGEQLQAKLAALAKEMSEKH